MTVGCYPGSFNPPTTAHLAIANAARKQCDLERLDLVVSREPLGKERVEAPRLEDRLAVLDAVARSRPWLGVRVTDKQLLADVADGYDILVVGADKWAQLNDSAWYGGSDAARDAALARLPHVVVAPRPPWPVPPERELRGVDLATLTSSVSSTAARTDKRHWMAPEAADFDTRTGAWTDPARYLRWLEG
jgi:nicotinic acid mononucleotide adenylyltransferase